MLFLSVRSYHLQGKSRYESFPSLLEREDSDPSADQAPGSDPLVIQTPFNDDSADSPSLKASHPQDSNQSQVDLDGRALTFQVMRP